MNEDSFLDSYMESYIGGWTGDEDAYYAEDEAEDGYLNEDFDDDVDEADCATEWMAEQELSEWMEEN